MDKHKNWKFFFVRKGKMKEEKKIFKMASCFEMAIISMQIHYIFSHMDLWIYYGRRYVVMQTRYHQVSLTMSMANPLPVAPMWTITQYRIPCQRWAMAFASCRVRRQVGKWGSHAGQEPSQACPQFWEYPTLGTSLNIKQRLAQSFFLTTYTKKAQQRHQSSSTRQKRTYYALPKAQICNGNTNIFHVTFVEGMNSIRFLHHVHVRALPILNSYMQTQLFWRLLGKGFRTG